MKAPIKNKMMIAVMVVGFIALLPMAEQASSNDKQFHQRCNTAWENSPVADKQACRAHKINYDHISEGGTYLMCFFDVYCHDGHPYIQGGYRKGVAKEADLRQFRRCKDSPGTISTNCEALEYPYLNCKQQFSLSPASATCEVHSQSMDSNNICKIQTACLDRDQYRNWQWYTTNYANLPSLYNCNGWLWTSKHCRN